MVLMLIHGGSWKGIDPGAFRATLATSVIFRNLGYETLTVDYRRGALGVTDVDRLYQEARRQVGPKASICAVGVSAGGHLALMLATRHKDLSCVIDLAGPTDLPAMKSEPNGSTAYLIAVNAFGVAPLSRLSPALHAKSIKAKLLLVYAQTDHLVPVAQGYAMAHAYPRAKLIVLPAGNSPFVHTGIGASIQDSGVDTAAYAHARQQELDFLNGAAGSG